MKRLPAPDILIRQWLQNPHAITVAAFVIAAIFLGLAGWFIHRNLRHNEPGLRAPFALPSPPPGFSARGVCRRRMTSRPAASFARSPRFSSIMPIIAGGSRDPAGKIVADRWQIVLAFACFRWLRDKANRHFFFSGDTGSGKTSCMNGLLAALIRRNPTLGGVVMANKGHEWFYLEWLAKKYGRT